MKTLARHQNEFSDIDFLKEFDAEKKEFSVLTAMIRNGNPADARALVVEHFRKRNSPLYTFDLRSTGKGSIVHPWSPVLQRDRDAILKRADEICRNYYYFQPGLALDFGPTLDWVTPQTCDSGVPGNMFRCHHFIGNLAMAYAQTRHPHYAEKFAELMDRWASDWPFEVTDNFSPDSIIFGTDRNYKTMPTGQRLMNWWTALYSGLPFAREVSTETAFRFLKTLWFTAAQYLRFEKARYAANNHHMMRCGLVPAVNGILLPETPRMEGLLTLARRTFQQHAAQSFLSDGGYLERSVGYSMVTMKMFLIPVLLGRKNNVSLLETEGMEKVRSCSEALCMTLLPHGTPCSFGDGHVSRSGGVAFAGMTYGAFGGEAGEVIDRLGLRRDLPPELRPEKEKNPFPPKVLYQPVTGFFIARSAWSKKASAMAMSIPNGENPSTGHAQDDALSLQLVAKGVPFITPASEWLYVAANKPQYRGTPERGYTYSMEAQNLILVHGKARIPPEQFGNAWGVLTPAVESSWSQVKGGVSIIAGHRGYEGFPLTREVVFRFRSGWTIRDRVEGTSTAPHIQRWNFDAEVDVEEIPDGIRATRDGVELRFRWQAAQASATLYPNEKWMQPCADACADRYPSVLDISFDGNEDSAGIETTIEIVAG